MRLPAGVTQDMLTAAIKQSADVRLTTIQVPDLDGDGNEQGASSGAKKRARGVHEAEGLDRVLSEVKRRPGARRATKAAAPS